MKRMELTKAIGNIAIRDDESRIVEGYFTDDKVDYYGHIIAKSGTISALADYEKWGNIRDMHQEPIGTVVEIGKKAWNHLAVKIFDDEAWKKVKAGVYKGFSVGIIPTNFSFVPYSYIEENTPDAITGLPESLVNVLKDMDILYIEDYLLGEISIVDRPANPRAIVTEYKSLNGSKESRLMNPKLVKYYMEDGTMEDLKNTEEQLESEEQKGLQEEVIEESLTDEEQASEETVEKSMEDEAEDGELGEDFMEKALVSIAEGIEKVASRLDAYEDAVEQLKVEVAEIKNGLIVEEEPQEDAKQPEKGQADEQHKAVEPKQDNLLEDKLNKMLKRLDELVKSEDGRVGINKGVEAEEQNAEPEREIRYEDLAKSIAVSMGG